MILIIVGVVIILFSMFVYFTAQGDFKESPWDFTPYEDEAILIYITQKIASAIMDIVYLGTLFLGAYAIVTGFGSLM